MVMKLTAFVKDIPASPISFFVFLSGVWGKKGETNKLQMPHFIMKIALTLTNEQKSIYKWIPIHNADYLHEQPW